MYSTSQKFGPLLFLMFFEISLHLIDQEKSNIQQRCVKKIQKVIVKTYIVLKDLFLTFLIIKNISQVLK